ncbi:MAG TPA: glycerol-3-phosphate 1-O-acyltransferase PlsY [Candidatus Manganitrophaceae bacterium]|nr:glycerol-3-phosphate 1-O-acyltransferase PlsY [Candidatus Manganitrophaceae bacterium]
MREPLLDINAVIEIGAVLAAYLIGSIPFGLLVAKALRGVDPRRRGSGNIGATNVLRVAGKREALLTLLADFLKGAFPVGFARWLNGGEGLLLTLGLAAILGHIFPLFLSFKGGKGVATSFGVFMALSPLIALAAALVWGAGVYFGKYSSVGALAAFIALPFLALLIRPERRFALFSFGISALVCVRHRENIVRLIHGAEGRGQQP